MQRILLSALVVGGVVGAAIYGTSSFFSDTETSTGNTFTAGSVSLTIDDIDVTYDGDEENAPKIVVNDDDNAFSFAIDDIKPLDNGTITYNLTNGANEAHVCALVTDATSAPEANDTALASMMNFLFGSESGTVSTAAGQWQSLGTMTPGELDVLSVDYCFGVYDGTTCVLDDIDYNPAQLGQMVVDLEFYAEQTRNNPNFTCASLNKGWEQTPPLSGQNETNKSLNRPHINWSINGPILEVKFVNPTNFFFDFDYRINEESGVDDAYTAMLINQGELAGNAFGQRYNTVSTPANTTQVRTFNANDVDGKLDVILRRGAEQNWYLNWITFQAN